jgi:hypothetical protein
MTGGGGGLVGEAGEKKQFLLFFIFFKIFNLTDMWPPVHLSKIIFFLATSSLHVGP